jgi:V8-like Glu-specific endopeptidase
MSEADFFASVDNPKPGRAVGLEAAPVRQQLEGSLGALPAERGRAAKLIVHGKDPAVLDRSRRRSGRALETVLGHDDRVRILETDLAPWRMICALEIESPSGSFIGTGWFIGPRTLLTAGHCVYGPDMGGWATTIRLAPGRDEDDLPFGSFTSQKFSTTQRWIDAQDPDFDYAAIHLAEPVGEKVGWFSLAVRSPEELKAARVNISGYPGDRGNGRQQWFDANSVLAVTPRRVFYSVDTYGGQSGSPVWIQDDPASPPVAVGIHAYGVGGTPTALGIVANSAPRISAPVLTVVQGWLKGAPQ